jgi:RNA polymerase sigma-70 factor, ECF subfamily
MEEEFLELVERNQGRLRRLARLYASDPSAAEDLYQEMLVQLWRSLPGFRAGSSLDTWVYRVALNTALGQRRREEVRQETALEPHHLASDDGATPHEELEHRRRLDLLYGAIGRLPEVDRALVAMHLDGCGYREMSEVLGLSETNVGVRLHRVRQRLKDELSEDER